MSRYLVEREKEVYEAWKGQGLSDEAAREVAVRLMAPLKMRHEQTASTSSAAVNVAEVRQALTDMWRKMEELVYSRDLLDDLHGLLADFCEWINIEWAAPKDEFY